MFPIRDHNPSGRTPYVTYALMAANIVIFVSYLAILGDDRALFAFFGEWGIVPARLSFGEGYHTLFTSIFLHAGFMHLAGNMLFLFIFGDNLEDEMGHVGFALFYLKGVCPPDIKLLDIYKGVIPFIILQLLALVLLIFAPQLALWLPSVAYS